MEAIDTDTATAAARRSIDDSMTMTMRKKRSALKTSKILVCWNILRKDPRSSQSVRSQDAQSSQHDYSRRNKRSEPVSLRKKKKH